MNMMEKISEGLDNITNTRAKSEREMAERQEDEEIGDREVTIANDCFIASRRPLRTGKRLTTPPRRNHTETAAQPSHASP